jgi:hypothetical protein
LYGFSVIVIVLPPLEKTGRLPRLRLVLSAGVFPVPYQYSGRNMSHWNSPVLATLRSSGGSSGKI